MNDPVAAALEAEVVGIIADHITNQPRTLQRAVGPSELGTPCRRKLAHKLAGTPPTLERGPAWKPFIGTAGHKMLEEVFARHSMDRCGGGRWWIETRVHVGDVDGQPVHGSCDLYDEATGTVVDWKFTTRNKIRETYRPHGPGSQYRAQAHLYGRGWANRGMTVHRVAIFFLTRDGELADRLLWSEPYDEAVALDTLARATEVSQLLALLGPEVAIPLQPTTDDHCRFCEWYQPGSNSPATSCPGANPAAAEPTSLAGVLGTTR